MKRFLSLVSLVALSAQARTYKIDVSHASVGFVVKHLMLTKVHGQFKVFDGEVTLNDKTKALEKANGSIDANSIDTNNEKRDAHLKSPDFFDTAKNPKLSFKLTKVEDGKATGELTMHGMTKPVTLDYQVAGPTKDPWGNEVVVLAATGKINRKDWGLTWNKALESGGVLVSEEVELEINAEANSKK